MKRTPRTLASLALLLSLLAGVFGTATAAQASLPPAPWHTRVIENCRKHEGKLPHVSKHEKKGFMRAERSTGLYTKNQLDVIVACHAENKTATSWSYTNHPLNGHRHHAHGCSRCVVQAKDADTYTQCWTDHYTATAHAWTGIHVFDFTSYIWYCRKSSWDGPSGWHDQIVNEWDLPTMEGHTQHNTGFVVGVFWKWEGFDPSNSYVTPMNGALDASVQGHFSEEVGIGPLSMSVDDRYPYVDWDLNPDTSGTIYYGW